MAQGQTSEPSTKISTKQSWVHAAWWLAPAQPLHAKVAQALRV
jgi:hypothetical protein